MPKLRSFFRWFSLVLLPSSIFLCCLFYLREARGDEFKLTPSLGLTEEYDDNLFFSEKNKVRDFITTISPGLELSDRTERLDLNLFGRLSWLFYADHQELNALDYDVRGKLLYAILPNLDVSADAGSAKYSTPDQDLETTGLVTRLTTQYRYYLGIGLGYSMTERTRASLSYSYEREVDDYGKELNLLDTTTDTHDVTVGFTHDLSQYLSNTVGRANLGYSRYQYRNTTVNYYYGTVGMSQALSEKWNILLDVGPSYTASALDAGGLELSSAGEEGIGVFAQATLSYQGEKTTGDLTFNHGLSPGSGTTGVTENTQLALKVAHRFTYELSGRLSTGIYLNQAVTGFYSITGFDEATFLFSPALRYDLTKDIALEASYRYSLLKDRSADTKSEGNLFMIYFTIKYPLFE